MVVVETNPVEGVMALVKAGGPATILGDLAMHAQSVKTVHIVRPTPRRTVISLRLNGWTPLFFQSTIRQTVPQDMTVGR